MSLGVSDQARRKLACAVTEASSILEISDIRSRDIILSKQRTIKALIRLHGCAGWSAPLLFTYGIKHIFSWSGSFSFGNFVKRLHLRKQKNILILSDFCVVYCALQHAPTSFINGLTSVLWLQGFLFSCLTRKKRKCFLVWKRNQKNKITFLDFTSLFVFCCQNYYFSPETVNTSTLSFIFLSTSVSWSAIIQYWKLNPPFWLLK